MPKQQARSAATSPDSNEPLVIGGQTIEPGQRVKLDIPVASSFGQAETSLRVVVARGRKPGPRLFVSAAVHGDEINGVEIIRRLLGMSALRTIHGTLIAIPVVNIYGFTAQNRYLPDRRDLNRAFPGSPGGSLAARLAHTFMNEVVGHCTHGIDLHTGAVHRANLPQIRACFDQPETERLARAFGTPVLLPANVRDGSLRQAAFERDMPMLLYEAGEALRFDEVSIRAGVRGVISVMRALDMLRASKGKPSSEAPIVCNRTRWERAPAGGILRPRVQLGDTVVRGAPLATLSDHFGDVSLSIIASMDGIVIGQTRLPLVNEGDAIFHLGACAAQGRAADSLAAFHAELVPEDQVGPSGEHPIL